MARMPVAKSHSAKFQAFKFFTYQKSWKFSGANMPYSLEGLSSAGST